MRRGKRERTSKVLALPGVDVRQRAVGEHGEYSSEKERLQHYSLEVSKRIAGLERVEESGVCGVDARMRTTD